MKRLMILAIAALALFGIAKMWWHVPAALSAAEMAGMPPLQELYVAAGANKLSDDHFEDRSVVFRPKPTQ